MKQPDPFLLLIENLQDPGNLGTMIRTAEGAGVTGILISRESVDLYNPKTIRSTMGSIYRVPVHITDSLTCLLYTSTCAILRQMLLGKFRRLLRSHILTGLEVI